MVLFKTTETHCSSLLKAINCLRKEKTLCDACILVGDKQFPAHRNVLVTGSDYFRSHYLGPLSEESMPNVDLSSVTTDVDAVEAVVNFLYTGEINIDDENLETVLKVSSFLLISQLRKYCIDFIVERLDLNTCLKYFMHSVKHTILDVEKKAYHTVKSRFHDHLIFQTAALELSPEQLLYLIDKLSIFEHCGITDILQYVTEWVRIGATKEHELLGCDILDYVYSNRSLTQKQYNEAVSEDLHGALEQLKNNTQLLSNDTSFMDKLKKVICKYSSQLKYSQVGCTLRSHSSRRQSLVYGQHHNKIEDVLITVIPKQNAVDYCSKKHSDWYSPEEGEADFDVYIYVPRTKSWHYLHSVTSENNRFNEILSEIVSWQMCSLIDSICLVGPLDEGIERFSLKDFTWTHTSYNSIKLEETESAYCDNILMCADGETMYLLLSVKVYDDECSYYQQVYYKCYRLAKNNTWSFIFSSPKIDIEDDWVSNFAAVSPVSNEMIIVYCNSDEYGEKELLVYIADLSMKEPTAVKIHAEPGSDWPEFHIIEGRNQFYILEVERRSKGLITVSCKYEYKFKSNVLICCQGAAITIEGNAICNDYREGPVKYRVSSNSDKSLWIFGGNKENGSFLVEVQVDEKGRLLVYNHKPPPFSCVALVIPGKVQTEDLKSLKEIKHYVQENFDIFWVKEDKS